MLLDHADFALQEQAEDNLMVAFSSAWYNGSYTMAAKPIKSLELHYTMIQFLIMSYMLYIYCHVISYILNSIAFISHPLVGSEHYFCYLLLVLKMDEVSTKTWINSK